MKDGLWITPCWFERPLYEYDVLLYNGTIPPNAETLYPDVSAFAEKVGQLSKSPSVRIAILGPDAPNTLDVAGLPFLTLGPADENLSELIFCRHETNSMPEIIECIASMNSSIALPIHRFIMRAGLPEYPINNVPLIVNRNGDLISLYGTVWGGYSRLAYLALPSFRDNAQALVAVLEVLARISPIFSRIGLLENHCTQPASWRSPRRLQ
jgi:hypothetical protein